MANFIYSWRFMEYSIRKSAQDDETAVSEEIPTAILMDKNRPFDFDLFGTFHSPNYIRIWMKVELGFSRGAEIPDQLSIQRNTTILDKPENKYMK